MYLHKFKPLKQTLIFLFLIAGLSAFSQDLVVHPINRDDSSYGDLKPLKEMIGDKRIVFLGEAQHTFGELISDKIRVMKFLCEQMGFNTVAFESGIYDLDKAWSTIKKGGNVEAAIHQSIFSIWTRQEEFRPFTEYINKHRDSLLLLGFDNQFSGEYFYETFENDLKQFTKLSKKEVNDEELTYWLENVEDLTSQYYMEAPMTVFQLIHKRIVKVVSKTPASEERDLMLRVLDGIEAVAKFYDKSPVSTSREQFKASDNNVRDEQMSLNLLYWLRKYPNRKFIVWAANAHLANRVDALQHGQLKDFEPMGQLVRKEVNDEVISLFFTGTPADSLNDPAALENKYVVNNSYVDLRSQNAAKSLTMQALDPYEPAVNGDWSQVTDLIWFSGHLTEAHDYIPDLQLEIDNDSVDSGNDIVKESMASEPIAVKRVYIENTTADLSVRSKIVDPDTRKGLEFVNIGLKSGRYGTISNYAGNLTLKIPSSAIKDSVRISLIGYETRYVSVRDLLTKPVIYLKASSKLKTVVISAKKNDAVEIMRKVINAIPDHFNQNAFTVKVLSQENIKSKNGGYKIHETLFDEYDDDGYRKVPMYPIRYQGFSTIYGSRYIDSDSLYQLRDSVHAASKVGMYEGFGLGIWDVVDYRNNNFLNKANLGKYKFQLIGGDVENGVPQYVIGFSCKKPKFRRTTGSIFAISYIGELYVNKTDFAITRVNTYSVRDGKKEADFFYEWIERKLPYDSTEVYFVKNQLEYAKIGKYYYNVKTIQTENLLWGGSSGVETLISIDEKEQPKPKGNRRVVLDKYDPKSFELVDKR